MSAVTSSTADRNHGSSGPTARQLLGLGDNDGRGNHRNGPLPSYTVHVHNADKAACCKDTRTKLDLDTSNHEDDLGSSIMPATAARPSPTHHRNNDSAEGYRPEPNPTKILGQLQRMLGDEENKTNPPPYAEVQPERNLSFDREAWLATRPTIGNLTTPRPRPPPPPIPPAKIYNPFTEFCLRHNPLCWPCSDTRDKLPALEVFLNHVVNSNKPRYQGLNLLDENGKLPEGSVREKKKSLIVTNMCFVF
ncbi:hypothetical protein QBC32DRAFT_317635 [Pseudoneurospora amorphoporcata]|uniref:Uncharacterized protein n=1 Tax=Pseudoneurospora amorphoporcata TaxID=241081 RepID=A0AAN6NRP4_9PEZI|nr:hypothetical protein QBC32DRAFT_317635 [Pseudoneurospora amorphoporcata]